MPPIPKLPDEAERNTGRGWGEKRAQAFCIHCLLVLPWTVPTLPVSQAVLKTQGHSYRVDRPLKTAKCHACGTGPQACPASSKKCVLPPSGRLPWLFLPTLMHILLCQHQAWSALFPLPDTFAHSTPATDPLHCLLTHLPHFLFGTFDHSGEKLGTVVSERLSDHPVPLQQVVEMGLKTRLSNTKLHTPSPVPDTKAKQGQEAEG